MKCFLSQELDDKNRKITLLFLAIFCLSLIGGFIVGISGNRTGITLCYIATTALILAFTHMWRKVKNFVILLVASLFGFVIFVVLHNLFYALAELATDIIVLRYLLEFLHAAFFLIALILCPSGLVVGAVGSLFLLCWWLKKLQTRRSVRSKDLCNKSQ